jgi:hypothetical protein
VYPPFPGVDGDPIGEQPAAISLFSVAQTMWKTYHNSGGTGLTTSQSSTPSTANQNFAQCGALRAPPSFHSVALAFCIRASSASTPNNLKAV